MAKPAFSLYKTLFTPTPELKRQLKMAHMQIEPARLIRRSIMSAFYLACGFCIVIFFIASSQAAEKSIITFLIPLMLFPVLFFVFYLFFNSTPRVYIRRRERDINRNLVFATRYIIVKMEGGQPLLNSMISASRSYGVGAKFFQEIVDDVQLGKPIEQALDEAHDYSPSRLFQLVLRQILNALRTGIDVSGSLRKILDEITRQQQIEIKEYSKKLNSLVLFYLIIACVMPSLGISMFLVVGSMVSLVIDVKTYALIITLLFVLQMVFIGMFKSIKPMVEI
jgi:archaeal flagellar protein FlaJ